ncbi:uncharacterized protein LOC131652921 isoform X2 [Vicia villosa]|uniref:uncharacterized protein LOC131652921 isoform X2 n=1 Tax=Vicia villosa TaxID=3911 RepID=UPI00273AFFE9|nr:uncharacterized protein LOC131652921 isoform X2 [Vicia villosa]XP_058778901.1 uncharacterized protein LOC131652921 isoform X2 [Vicia villosa]XP_058778902.1 uncharacterized protein LOC131652921 isoform X2 [Vicia villosa]XP_058778903.1 uncharacterized protein LOC131652921 isoform X2 [Vicia villosa]
MTGEGSKKKEPMNKKPFCRTRHMPPGALAVNTSRFKHDTRNKSTTSRKRQTTQAPPPPQTTTTHPPPQTTTVTPPPHTTTAPPPPHLNAAPPAPRTTEVASPPQTAEAAPQTIEECTFVPTPGVTQHVLQGPAVRQTTVAVEDEGRDQTFSGGEEEAAEQASYDGQRPMISIGPGDGLTPSGVVAEVIRKVFIKLYRGKFLRYSELKVYNRRHEREAYFNLFKSLVQWESCDERKMKSLFHRACGKRIADMFGKIRKKGTKPDWMGEKVYAYLLDGWKSDEFKKTSQQNKTNRASTRGGAVHTTGRKAHHDVAKEMEKKLGRPPNPDELFMATHKKRNGQWVDRRAEKTHEDYVNRLTQATQNDNNVDGSEKIQLWKEAAGGKSRGRCYGTGLMAVNVQYGVSCLTEVTVSKPNREVDSQAIEAAKAEACKAREEAALANARADKAIAETADLKRQFEEFQKQLWALQSSQTGPSHGHYDDDNDSLDLEEMSDGC